MKIVFLLQNHSTVFGMDITQISDKGRYKIYLIVNKVGLTQLTERKQEHLFEKLFTTEDFSFANLQQIINGVIVSEGNSGEQNEINIVTNSGLAISVCGKLRQYFKVDDQDFERYNDKVVMKQTLTGSDIEIPKYQKFDKVVYKADPVAYIESICKQIPFPMFVKPIDQAGSVGTKKILSKVELETWASKAIIETYEFEIDEFIEGTLYHCDSFIKGGKILFTQVCEDLFPCYDFIFGKPQGSIPLLPDSDLNKAICSYTEKVINTLGSINAGVTHLEIFRKSNGDFVFLEIAPRAGGALIPQMYKKYLNIDLVETHINLQIKEDFEPHPTLGIYTAWVSFPNREGKVNVLNSPILNSQYEINWRVKKGQNLVNPQKLANEACNILFWNDNYQTLLKDFEYLKSFSPYTLSSEISIKESLSQSQSMTFFNSSSTIERQGGKSILQLQ